jgi:hypothetical protein
MIKSTNYRADVEQGRINHFRYYPTHVAKSIRAGFRFLFLVPFLSKKSLLLQFELSGIVERERHLGE